jgi:hypothetical protein
MDPLLEAEFAWYPKFPPGHTDKPRLLGALLFHFWFVTAPVVVLVLYLVPKQVFTHFGPTCRTPAQKLVPLNFSDVFLGWLKPGGKKSLVQGSGRSSSR